MSLLNEMTPHAPATTIKKNAKPHKAEVTRPLRVGFGALSIAEASESDRRDRAAKPDDALRIAAAHNDGQNERAHRRR